MYSSTWARWIPTSGSMRLVSHQSNQRRSWKAYKLWVCPEYQARYETTVSWPRVIESGWKGSRMVFDMACSPAI